jgi:hypothetical protein
MPRFERKITLREAEDIRNKMIQHHRLDGFIYKEPNNTITFLTDKPMEGGSLITLADLDFIIQARKIEVE